MIAALAALTLLAPQQDNDALKKKILQDVEKRLKAQDDRLLKDIERVIEEELGRPKAAAPAPAAKPEAPRKGRGYMGVRPGDLSDEEKAGLKIKTGIKVVEVVEGGPGEKAGLKKDDVITAIDGRAIDSPQDVPTLVQAAGAGAKLKVDILRGGEKKTLEVTLGKHPLDEQQGKAEPPADGDLRERLKKFKEAEPRQDPPKAPAKPAPKPAPKKEQEEPSEEDDLFAFDDTMMEQFRGLFEQFGMDPEQFFDQGKDGKYRFKKDWSQLFKGMEKFFKDMPRGLPGLEPDEEPAPEPPPAPKKPAAKKAPAAPRVWMGFLGEEVGDDLRAQLDLEGGVLVTDVSPGGPAEKAGLKKSDVILKMDGKPVKGPDDLAGVISGAKAGQELTLVVLRKGKEQTLKVTLAERKE